MMDSELWSTPVEMQGTFARLIRMDSLHRIGLYRPGLHWMNCILIGGNSIRVSPCASKLSGLVDRFPLKAADAQQLAAALTWCLGRTKGRALISGDSQLLDAARQLGFQAVTARLQKIQDSRLRTGDGVEVIGFHYLERTRRKTWNE